MTDTMVTTTTLPRFETGMKIRFADEKSAYTVQAVAGHGRYVVCTKPFNLRKTVMYTIIDLAQGIRGADNRIFGMGYETTDDCQQSAAAFAATDTYETLRAAGEHIDTNDPTWLERHPELVNRTGFAYPDGTEISYRNWVWLRLDDNQPDPRVAEMVPALRALLAQAPARNYNDHQPRTTAELGYRP